MSSPELLAPVGTLRHLHHALAYGADAVYAGIPRYSLRVRNNDFHKIDQLAAAISACRSAGRRFYLATNILPHDAKITTLLDDLAPVIALRPDALIVADPGVLMLLRERWPDLELHLSVQANCTNSAAVRFWAANGIRRIILSRELSLDEVARIRDACPDTELEVFVHGALCIAYSGRCLLSGYFNHRDANQGTCTNACRWSYAVTPTASAPSSSGCSDAGAACCGGATPAGSADVGQVSRHPAADQPWLLEESERPGQQFPIEEDEHGTYIMNSRDLRAVEHVARLAAIGVDSLKIEGRTKSYYYVARTTQIYRQAIDDAVAGRPFDRTLYGDLEALANRGYTDGFFARHSAAETQSYQAPSGGGGTQRFVAEVIDYDAARGEAQLQVKNRFAVGDELLLITPAGNQWLRVEQMWQLDGTPISVAPGGGWQVRLPLPAAAATPYALLARLES